MEWLALQHALLSHLPVAIGLLLPWPLLAAQRRGRGFRSWWTVARYLSWAGVLGILGSLLSGLAMGRLLSLLPDQRSLTLLAFGDGPQLHLLRHALLGAVSLLLGGAAVWAMNRPRKDYESLGLLALSLGLLWSLLLLVTGERGFRLAQRHLQAPVQKPIQAPVAAAVVPPVPPPQPRPEADPEAGLPLRALDFASLVPIQADPVKSLAHGGRWIRAYASPEAAGAYRAGSPLPQGALIVLSSVEDRWGRPGPEVGPVYALDMKVAGPALTFYWGRIPEARRGEFAGESRVYWRGSDAHLDTCRACHAEGMADPAKRSRWRPKKVVPAE